MSQYTIKRFSLVTLLSIAGFLVSTCTQNKEQPATVAQAPTRMAPPQIVLLSSLPDSSQPQKIDLKNRPASQVKRMIIPPEVHSFIDPLTNTPLLPESQGQGHFTNFTTEQGLISDELNCTVMDSTGAIWFGLGGGINRYDGTSFTSYTTKQGLANDAVWAVLKDKKGRLWAGTDGGGASCFDGQRFANYTTKQGLAGNTVYSFLEDKRGNIWIGTFGGGVSRYDGKRFINFTMKQGLPDDRIMCMREDKSGQIWFATFGGGVSCYDGKHFTNYGTKQGLTHNEAVWILEDKKGQLWFGTDGGGVSRYNGQRFTNYTTKQGLAHNDVMTITEDKAGLIWITTFGGGVSYFNGKRFVTYSNALGLANNFATSTLEDKGGSLWFTTLGGGVSRYAGKSCINYTTRQGLTNNSVSDIFEDTKGAIWVGTKGGGVSRYDGATFTNYTSKQGLAYDVVYGIVEDKQGDLWFGTTGNGGICQFDGRHFTNYTTAQGLASNFIRSVLRDKTGDLWFGTFDGGVSHYDGKSFTNYTTKQGLASNTVTAIVQDKKGNIWFCTMNGISCFTGKGFTNYTTDQGLADNSVWGVLEDKMGNLWFSSLQGISRYDGKSFINYTDKDGLPSEGAGSICADSSGNILIGAEGIGVLTGFLQKGTKREGRTGVLSQNSLSNEDLKNYIPQIEIYNTSTGYPIKGAMSLRTDRKGITWIGTGSDKTGLVRFDYSAIHKDKTPPHLVLQSVKINNQTVSWQSLRPESTPKRATLVSTAVAPNITEEVTTFGKELSETERDSMRHKFGDIHFEGVRKWYPIPENLVLPYKNNTITIDFAAVETTRPNLVKYQYKLDGYDEEWSSATNKTTANYGNLPEGKYTFIGKAKSPYGVWSQPLTYTFRVLPPWWRTWWAYLLYALAVGGAIWAFVAYRSRALRRENRILEEKVSLRTDQLQKKSSELETSLTNLKVTQTQLVQKEKMASLGELTAGIAHEIQNPLNFVNNFSELSSELVEELEEEQHKPQRDTDLEIELMTDLKDNLTKILHHGNRASSIVKGMLEHARSSTGEILPTDLNKLTEEYLRLAYQGLRAKDKQFNCALETYFDASIGQVSVMPQEIGRVLLNLFNNAFYAVHQQQTLSGEGYQPSVVVTTSRTEGQVTITVRDNGTGMSDAVKAKIFQPFFTTKPTGQGTGLGLSLSYDIVTKGHRGNLTVSSQEGQGTEFVVQLPAAPEA